VLIAVRLITAIVSLAGAEGVLGLLGYPAWRAQLQSGTVDEYEIDPDLGWRNKAGVFDLAGPHRNDVFRYTNWSDGRRATSEQQREHDSVARPQAAFFGDSYVQGYGLSDNETFAWIYQHRHPELRVDNFGTANYGTYQSFLALKKNGSGAAHVYYLLNGFHEERNVASASWIRITKPPAPGSSFPYAVLEGDSIVEHRSSGELVWWLSWKLRTVAMLQDYCDLARAYPRMRNRRRVTQLLLAKMSDTVAAHRGKFAVILFDMTREQRASYSAFLRSHSIASIDCARPELNDRSLRLPDGHPNPRLNELLVGWIEPKQVTRNSRN
jgi:hypothetical protein